jgi:thioredoxin-related protein
VKTRRASSVLERRRLAEKGKLREVSRVRHLRLLVIAVAFFAASCSQKKSADKTADNAEKTANIAAKPGWLTSYEQAQKESQAKHRLLLMDFTGSDWCGWCIMLDKEIFSKPEFKEYASKNLVLLELDFPRNKRMPAETVAQNERLAIQYRISGFPTVLVFDSAGKQVGMLGYTPGGPQAFIAQLEKLRKG